MGCFRQGNCMINVTVLRAPICLSSIGDTQEGRRPPPRMGWGRRPYGFAVGLAPSADGALGRWGISRRARRGCFAGFGQRVFRPLRRVTGGAAPGLRDFGLPAARWQEWSARNFSSEQAVGSQPYWMYGKKPHRSYGGKGPASTADTRVAGSPVRKKRVKLLTFFLFLTMARMGTAFTTAAAAPTGAADQHKKQPAHHQSHQEPVQPRHRTNPTI